MANSINLVDCEVALALVQEYLDYDQERGIFLWKKRPGPRQKLGQQAGSKNTRGYHHIKLRGHTFKVHRLVWLVEHGCWPQSILDHIDGNTSNNRISNLRQVTYSENQFNRKLAADNTSGHRGVSWDKNKLKWCQFLSDKHLGYFSNKDLAIEARLLAESLNNTYIRNT